MTKPVQYPQYISKSNLKQWLNQHPKLDSSKGYITTDIDQFWMSYKTNKWMLIEEKCRMVSPKFSQQGMLHILHQNAIEAKDTRYQGFHLLQFTEEGPEDTGQIYLDDKLITIEQLEKFYMFSLPDNLYSNGYDFPLVRK